MRWMLLVVLAAGRIAIAAEAADEQYLAALAANRYSGAARIAETELGHANDRAASTRWAVALGVARSLAGDSDGALDAFGTASPAADWNAFDRSSLHALAQSCKAAQAYASAREALAVIARRYPDSPLSRPDDDLARAIDERIAKGVVVANLNWCRDREARALAADHAGAAIVFAHEFVLLAHQAGAIPEGLEQAVSLDAGIAAEQLGDAKAAWAWLESVPATADAGRAAIARGLALEALGRRDDAVRDYDAAAGSSDPAVCARAASLKQSAMK